METAFPPLVHLGAALSSLLQGGFSFDAAALSIGPWLFVLVLATYGLGNAIGGPGPGLGSAVMVAGWPLVLSLSHKFLLDLPMTAMVALCLWALVGSRGFTRPWWALLCGLAFGLALLAKFIAGIYLLGAFIWVLAAWLAGLGRKRPMLASTVALLLLISSALLLSALGTWLSEWLSHSFKPPVPVIGSLISHDSLTPWWHLLALTSLLLVFMARRLPSLVVPLSLGAAAIAATWLAGTWYVTHLDRVLIGIASFSTEGGVAEGDPAANSLAGWLYYPWAMGRILPRSWLHLLLAGWLFSSWRADLRRSLAPVMASLLLAFLLINLSDNKEARYLLGMAPAASVLALAWVTLLPRLLRWLVWSTVGAVALLLMTGWVAVHVGAWNPPPGTMWLDDRVFSSGARISTGYTYPDAVHLGDVLRTPDFYAVIPLPRDMPFQESELPMGYTGP